MKNESRDPLISKSLAIEALRESYAMYDQMYRGSEESLFDALKDGDHEDGIVKGRQFGLEEAWKILESLAALPVVPTDDRKLTKEWLDELMADLPRSQWSSDPELTCVDANDLRDAILEHFSVPLVPQSDETQDFKTFTVFRTGDLSETHDENQAPISGEVPSFWGVVFPDGTCVLRWAGVIQAHSVWASFDDAMKVHGHFEPRYGTRIEFSSPAPVPLDRLNEEGK